MGGMSNPLVRRRLLGLHLERLRKRSGRTQPQVAKDLGVSVSTVVRIEAGTTRATRATILALLDLFNVTQKSERQSLLDLGIAGRQRGWWEGLNPQDSQYVAMEESASEIKIFGTSAIPSLLQTESYMRALLRSGSRPPTPERLDQQVELRKQRQKRTLTKPNPTPLWVILDEPVLSRQYGSEATMDGQLRHLAALSDEGIVRLQLLPLSAQLWVAGSFTLMNLRIEDEDWTYAHTEGIAGDVWLDHSIDVGAVVGTFNWIAAHALNEGDSRGLIRCHPLHLGD